jgi:hypothetical protein
MEDIDVKNNEMKDLHVSISCVNLFDRLWYCGTPVNQLNIFYRTGDIDNCSKYFSALTTCIYAKTIKDEKQRKEKLQSIKLLSPPQKSSILVAKSEPSWPS